MLCYTSPLMDSMENEVTHDFSPMFRVYKNGRIQRIGDYPIKPPSHDPKTDVLSKDVVISPDPEISARLYLPITAAAKLPLLIYFHGGGFAVGSAFSTVYHAHLNSLTAAAGVISVSVEYRLAPEHPVPACYEDCWEVLKWVEQTPDQWIKEHADLNRVFLAGDSAGANIAHNIAVRAGVDGIKPGLKIIGMALVHPYFEFQEPGKLWMYVCPDSSGVSDPRVNPAAEPGLLEKMACEKVQVFVAGEDRLKVAGWSYYETLKNTGWGGLVEIMETEGKGHVFHLFDPECEEAHNLTNFFAAFFQSNRK